MLAKQDRDFLKALDDLATVEKRLRTLYASKLVSNLAVLAGVAAFFYPVFYSLRSGNLNLPSPKSSIDDVLKPYFELCNQVVLLFLILRTFLAVFIHIEIRTLLTFKKLRDMYSND
jgi:hypothetical protein